MLHLILLFGIVNVATAGPYVQTNTFSEIQNRNEPQVVLFFFSTHPNAKKVVKMFGRVAKKIQDSDNFNLTFRRADGAHPANSQEFKDAGFDDEQFYFFTSLPEEGIVKYQGPQTFPALLRHIRDKHRDFDPSDVAEFTDEDSFYDSMDLVDQPLPKFVKFYEEWCQFCKRMKKTFQQAATFFKGKVDFIEVECSRDDETTAFCTRNGAASFPTIILFTGEEKYVFEHEEKSIGQFYNFFGQHSVIKEDQKQKSNQDAFEVIEDDSLKSDAEKNTESPEPTSQMSADVMAIINELSDKIKSLQSRVSDLEYQIKT